MTTLLFTFLIGLIVSSALLLALNPLCRFTGHVDHPERRKRHEQSTPLCGGIAIWVSTSVVALAVLPTREIAAFVSGAAILLVLGALDDRKHVPAAIRLSCQFFAVAICMAGIGHVIVMSVGPLTGGENIELGHFAIPMTVFAGLGVINAVNMIDGVDGLAGGFSFMVLAVILVLAAGTNAVNTVLLAAILGGIGGFLLFNLRFPWQARARAFLGDAGSLVLGFALTWFTIQASEGEVTVTEPVTAVWLIGLPLADGVYVIGTRLFRRANPLEADRYHLHHLFLRYGFSPGWTLYLWLSCAAGLMAIGLLGQYFGVPDWCMLIGAFVVLGFYCLAVSLAWRRLGRRTATRTPARHSG